MLSDSQRKHLKEAHGSQEVVVGSINDSMVWHGRQGIGKVKERTTEKSGSISQRKSKGMRQPETPKEKGEIKERCISRARSIGPASYEEPEITRARPSPLFWGKKEQPPLLGALCGTVRFHCK